MGEEYTLHEEAAPNGYTTVTDIKFTIGNDNKAELKDASTDGDVKVDENGNIIITDSKTKVTVSKQDIAGEEIAGAKIQIKDKDGKVVEQWTSGDDGTDENEKLKPHVIEGKLSVGEEYTLHEEAAPDGYNTVTDFTFTVDNDNKVNLIKVTTDGEAKVAEDGTLVVTDSKKATGERRFTLRTLRTNPTTGEPVPGAKLSLIDKESGEVLETWTSETTPRLLRNLRAGRTYTIHEEETPEGFAKADDVTVTLTEDGEIDSDKSTVKTDEEGTVLITKPKDSDKGNDSTAKDGVKAGDNDGGDGNKSAVKSTTPTGNQTDSAKSGAKASSSTANQTDSGKSNVKNNNSTTGSKTSGSSSGSGGKSATGSNGGTAGVNTGDDTNLVLPAVAAAGALAAILVLLYAKKKRGSR